MGRVQEVVPLSPPSNTGWNGDISLFGYSGSATVQVLASWNPGI